MVVLNTRDDDTEVPNDYMQALQCVNLKPEPESYLGKLDDADMER